jgi:F-type H+-transporting ATPase subunit alpha
VVSVWAGTSGSLDDVPIEDIRRFEQEFLDTVGRRNAGIYESIRQTGELSDDTTTALKDAVEDFRRGFEITGGGMLVSDEPAEPLDKDDVSRDAVTKRLPAGRDGQNGKDGQDGQGQGQVEGRGQDEAPDGDRGGDRGQE